MIVSFTHLEPQTSKGLTYLVMLGLAAVLSTGSIWSIWKRRITGRSTWITIRTHEEVGMLKGFREFISKGNVIDLAVGVIIGAAFGAIVDSLVKDVITPIIGMSAECRTSRR